MSVIKCRGIVLNEYDQGEADKALILLTKEFGKIRAAAKGARKPKSKYMAGSQPFVYGDFVLYNGKGFNAITQIDIIESFYNIRMEYEKLCFATYFLEIVDKTTYENAPNAEVLRLLIKALQCLCGDQYQMKSVAGAFNFKYMQFSGYEPEGMFCANCGEKQQDNQPLFFGLEGFICHRCANAISHKEKRSISYGTLYTINYIMASEINKAFQFLVDDHISTELFTVANLYLSHLDIKLKSQELLKDIIK